MRSWLALPLALAALAAGAPAGRSAPRPALDGPAAGRPAAFDVRVLRGRARLAQEESVRTLTPPDGPGSGAGEAALGLGSGAAVEVAWRALGSMRLAGPAEVEWGTAPETGELEVIVGAAAALEVEARRSSLRLELAHGWRLEVAQAALQIAEDPHGGWVVRHHGGAPARVRSRVPREERWPRVVRPGEEIRLGARPGR